MNGKCMNEGCEGKPGPHFSFETNGKLNVYEWCWPCWEHYIKPSFFATLDVVKKVAK